MNRYPYNIILKQLIRLSAPIVMANISTTLMWAADSMMVGRLGTSQLAAVGISGLMIWTFQCFFVGTLGITNTFVSQAFGAGNKEECRVSAWQGIWLSLFFFICLLGLKETLPFVFHLLGTSNDVTKHAMEYLPYRFIGAGGLFLTTVFTELMIGMKRTREPMLIALFANGVNVLLDYGLIYGNWGLPQMGVEGAGFATCLSQYLQCALFLLVVPIGKPIGLRMSLMKRQLKIGLPCGCNDMIILLGFVIIESILARIGDAHLAAWTIALAICRLSFIPTMGLARAASTLVGQNIGATKLKEAELVTYCALGLGILYMGSMGLLFYAFPLTWFQFFNNSPEVLAFAAPLLTLAAMFQVFDAILTITYFALRGAGDTKWVMIADMGAEWLVGIPLTLFLGVYHNMGVKGAFLGLTSQLIIAAILYSWRFQQGKWKSIRI